MAILLKRLVIVDSQTNLIQFHGKFLLVTQIFFLEKCKLILAVNNITPRMLLVEFNLNWTQNTALISNHQEKFTQ